MGTQKQNGESKLLPAKESVSVQTGLEAGTAVRTARSCLTLLHVPSRPHGVVFNEVRF